jgi:hypothetical protein
MNKLLLKTMRLMSRKSPVDVCAVCCAVLAITYKHMDDDDRDAIAQTIVECLTKIIGTRELDPDGKRVH